MQINYTNYLRDKPQETATAKLSVMKAALVQALKNTHDDVLDAVSLAFKYGQAKGYRAAKAEGRARA